MGQQTLKSVHPYSTVIRLNVYQVNLVNVILFFTEPDLSLITVVFVTYVS